jgi:phosphatidate cytidylyltransferase
MAGSMSTSPGKPFNWKNLGARVASGFVLVPAVIAAIWWDRTGWGVVVMAAIAACLLAYEWAVLSTDHGRKRVMTVIALAVILPVLAARFGNYDPITGEHRAWVMPAAWSLAALGAVIAAIAAKGAVERRADAAYGVIYIAPPCIALVWLHGTNQGPEWTMLLFMTTWFADTGAYAFGNIFKGPKLWPRFSPNKTWSGFFGGLLCGALAAVVVWGLTNMTLTLGAAALMGFFGALATMAGDLWESVLKRRFGVKDSSDLIPGHGGLLDRVDGLLFAVIVVCAARLIVLLGWAH